MISRTQAAVLSVLEPGGILSIDSMVRSTGISALHARAAVLRLQSVGLIFHGGVPGCGGYQITNRGRNMLSIHGRNS